MKRELMAGDRVVIRSLFFNGEKGVVDRVDPDGTLLIIPDTGGYLFAQPSNVKKLVKKKKPIWWLKHYESRDNKNSLVHFTTEEPEDKTGWVKVKECK